MHKFYGIIWFTGTVPKEPVPSVILSVYYLASFGSDLGRRDWFDEALVRIRIRLLIGQSSSFNRWTN